MANTTNKWIPESANSHYKTYSTFSGADIRAYIPFKDESTGKVSVIEFAELQTLSYSSHRVTKNIFGLGNQNPIGITQGNRTIAGSMIFYKFHMNAIDLLYDALGVNGLLLDQLPLFNVMIIIGNEYGSRKYIGIYGIKLITEGLVMSVQDLTSETTCQFVAMDIETMRNITDDELMASRKQITDNAMAYYTFINIEELLNTDKSNSSLRTNPVTAAKYNLQKHKNK